ncbi:PucR family transcriptional regulator [Streptomyces sp. NBC_01335]|uniref:PucR family transcriptional regulator n=1 Tax=Streptomyces sp. NBC_01335 TaxID=2903828 RepID=UPI002E100DA6|nr:PucR family transcriptional regulator [Streptomyces sp. NBC_01335]
MPDSPAGPSPAPEPAGPAGPAGASSSTSPGGPATPASPAGPPTPPVSLGALLAREELGLRRIAGPEQAELLWVHTSEMADPYPYLLGGELLLSAGVLLTDPEWYVSRVVEAGAAALGFGVRPVHESVPPGLAEACERHGLPLLEVPPETTFTSVARAVWQLMADARHQELRRTARAQQALASAAARPDPVPAVLHQLAAQLGGYAVLLSPEGGEIHTAGARTAPAVRTALSRLARVVAPQERRAAPASATETVDGTQLSAYALGGGHGLVLALATGPREPGDHTVAGMAVVLLSLLAAPHQGAGSADRSAALVRMLLGAAPGEVAPLLGSDGPWTVVHARRTRSGGTAPLTAGTLGASLGSALVDTGRRPDEPVRVLLTDTARLTPQPGWVLGASDPVPLDGLAAADTRASRALARAEATRTPLLLHRADRGLTDLLTGEAAEAHARTLLAPLSATLRETLRCWLSLHGSWDRTAVALKIHRNTVRQRVGRCAELLGTDLDDMDVRTELWFALRLT